MPTPRGELESPPRKERLCRSIPTRKLCGIPRFRQARTPVARHKVELRHGLLFGPRLTTICCNPLGFYLYLLIRKPFGSDCLLLNAKLAAGDFDVKRQTLAEWLEALWAEQLAWGHRGQHATCVHIEKAGDHRGNDWIACPPTHGEHRPAPVPRPVPVRRTARAVRGSDGRWSGQLKGGSDVRHNGQLKGSDVRSYGHSDVRHNGQLNASLYLAPDSKAPKESSPGAAAPRVPDGPRGGAAIPCPPEVAETFRALGSKAATK